MPACNGLGGGLIACPGWLVCYTEYAARTGVAGTSRDARKGGIFMPYKDPTSIAARKSSLERTRRWQAANPQRTKASAARYRESHRGKLRAYRSPNKSTANRRYYAAHVEAMRERARAYATAHPERHREDEHRRRARVRGATAGRVSMADIYKRDGGHCHICGKAAERPVGSLDHLVPLSHGGPHEPLNVRLAHRSCNSSRGNHGPAQLLML